MYEESKIYTNQEGKPCALITGHAMPDEQPNNPLHRVTLEAMLRQLVERYGWPEMGRIINIRCFTHDPSISSSLKFLRKTPWARAKVEEMYLWHKFD